MADARSEESVGLETPDFRDRVFELDPIGWIRTPWVRLSDCPKNPAESDALAEVDVFEPFRAGLASLDTVSHVILVYWLDRADRTMLTVTPPMDAREHGVFATRAPVRPNPIGMSIADLISLDAEAGRLVVRHIDCLSGTPLLDIKPYFATIDSKPNARVGWHDMRREPSADRGWPGQE
ncbi:MAG: tRNA (N6-threonylcarbamoyladenosine(37)-N6)-methyltransferase TrmO [Pseudomonadota bacterium]